MQKVKEMENSHSGGKDKENPTTVPLIGNCIQIRKSRLERMGQEKEEET